MAHSRIDFMVNLSEFLDFANHVGREADVGDRLPSFEQDSRIDMSMLTNDASNLASLSEDLRRLCLILVRNMHFEGSLQSFGGDDSSNGSAG